MAALEKITADDEFFNEMGYEYSTVIHNINRLGLQKDEDLSNLIRESQKKISDFIMTKNKEMAEIMKAKQQME